MKNSSKMPQEKDSKAPQEESNQSNRVPVLSSMSFLSRKRPEGFVIRPPVIAPSVDVVDLTGADDEEVIAVQDKNTPLSDIEAQEKSSVIRFSDSEISLTELPTVQAKQASPRSPSPEPVTLVPLSDSERLYPSEIDFTKDELELSLFLSALVNYPPDEFELFMAATMDSLTRTNKPGYLFLSMTTQFDKHGVSLLANGIKHAPPENLLLLLTEAEKQKNNGNISEDEYIQFLTTAKKCEENEDYAIIDYAVFHENPKLEICDGEPTQPYGEQEKYIITENNLYHYHPVTSLKKVWIPDLNLSSLKKEFPESTTLDLHALQVFFNITGHIRFPHLAENIDFLLFYMRKTLKENYLGNGLLYMNIDMQRTVLLGATIPGQSLLMEILLTHLYGLLEKEVISRDDFIGILNYPCYGECSLLMMMAKFAALEPLEIFTRELVGKLTEKEYTALLTHANQNNYTALHYFLQPQKSSFASRGKSLSSLQLYLAEIERLAAHVDAISLHLKGDDRLTALLTVLTSENEGLASAYLTHLDNTLSTQKPDQDSRLALLVGQLDRSPPRQAMARSFEIVHQFIGLLEKHLSEHEYYFILHTKDYSPDGMVTSQGDKHSLTTRDNLDCLVVADAANPDAKEINQFLREARQVARERIQARQELSDTSEDAQPSPKRRRESPLLRPFFNHSSPRLDDHHPASSNISNKP